MILCVILRARVLSARAYLKMITGHDQVDSPVLCTLTFATPIICSIHWSCVVKGEYSYRGYYNILCD
jgi:hypothetical protein